MSSENPVDSQILTALRADVVRIRKACENFADSGAEDLAFAAAMLFHDRAQLEPFLVVLETHPSCLDEHNLEPMLEQVRIAAEAHNLSNFELDALADLLNGPISHEELRAKDGVDQDVYANFVRKGFAVDTAEDGNISAISGTAKGVQLMAYYDHMHGE